MRRRITCNIVLLLANDIFYLHVHKMPGSNGTLHIQRGHASREAAVAAEPASPAAANNTLIPTLTLDQLHDSLWQQLPSS